VTDNPFNAVCSRCSQTISVHILYGNKAKCHDGDFSAFEVWEVVEVRRALGHKITPAMSYAAMKSREPDRD
jgi:hypothetical protein